MEKHDCNYDTISIQVKPRTRRRQRYQLTFELCEECKSGSVSRDGDPAQLFTRSSIPKDLPDQIRQYVISYFEGSMLVHNNHLARPDLTVPDQNGWVFVWETYYATANKLRTFGWTKITDVWYVFFQTERMREYNTVMSISTQWILQQILTTFNPNLIDIILEGLYADESKYPKDVHDYFRSNRPLVPWDVDNWAKLL